jgi:universal stress protein A
MSRLRRILYATDFSPASRAAFARAVEMARGDRAELHLVHVLGAVAPMVGDSYIPPKIYQDLETSARAAAQKQLATLATRARKRGVSRVRSLLLSGLTHEQIIRAARSRRADLLVIGTHGRTGLSKLFLGSVAGRVVASARCPVLTVRGR